MKSIISRIGRFVIRHKVSIGELSLLAAVTAVASYIAYSIDIFTHESHLSLRQETIDLDEALLLGVLIASGLLIFSWRRYTEQKSETRRRIEAERHARELAFQDVLTGLPNRRQFDDALKAAAAAPPRGGASHGVFLLDLNGFKQVNDIHGHGVGDEVLTIVAQRLQTAMREGDMVARFGGDEFAILTHHLAGPQSATIIANRVINALKTPIRTGSSTHSIGTGIGIALLPGDATSPEEAVRKADVALYRAKAEKRSAMRFFEEDMDRLIHERATLEAELRDALRHDAIHPRFEPTFDLKTQRVVGFEAIPKWLRAEGDDVAVERFIAIAEEAGLIHELWDRLLHEACAAANDWPAHVWLAMDIFPVQLKDRELPWRILQTLNEAGLSPDRLQLEITESALVTDMEAAQTVLQPLRAAGVKIALDNFGTGYSSLYHLRNFKVDKIKIDRSFIDSMATEKESAAIVSALVGLGQGFGLTVAAEGVDDLREGVSLLGNGCEQGQGALFGAALTAADAYNLTREPDGHHRTKRVV